MHTTGKLLLALGLLTTTSLAHAATTVVTLSFDDTFADQAQVGDMLAARGMHATFFVNSSRINQSSYMTMDQLMALQTAGNEIAGHTIDHLALGSLPEDEQRRQICNDRAQLLTMGFNVTNFAYPHGAQEIASSSIVTDCGYNAGRDASSLRSHDPETCTNCAYAEQMPPVNPLAIRTPVSIKSNITLADLQLNVTDAESHGGGWVPFVFHHVCDGCNTLSISPAVLTQFMDWLALRQGMGTSVKTVQDVIAGPLNAAVTGPAATPYVAADGNLLHNGSLEDDANGNMVPDCWDIGTGGGTAASYMSGPAPTAHTGGFAEQLSVVSGMTSSPRIISGQDQGACAPPVTPGHNYEVSAWYQASDPVILVAYYRNPLGWWNYWTKSPPLAAAADWTEAKWKTPNAPMNATAISVGISAVAMGTLSVDDIRLVDPAGPTVVPPDTTDGGDTTTPDDMGQATDDGGTTPMESSGCSLSFRPSGGVQAIAVLAALMLLFVLRRRAIT